MNIKQLTGIEGAKNATGLTVIIDIMRAATVEAYAFGQGAKHIIPVATKEEAFLLKKQDPSILLMGEEHGIKIPGFDFGNSPTEIVEVDLTGKTLVHRSTSGTQGLVNAAKASELIFGSFVTCSAIIRYIKKSKHEEVSIVAIDGEDSIFAKYLEDSLNEKKTDKEKVKQELYNHPGTEWFSDPKRPDFPESDINYALDFDKFNFLCLVEKTGGSLVTSKVEM
ncbi:MAG: 2-phosphosulfolactate phosphatase [Candidatus Levyibacteriota bacterium]